MSKKRSVKKTSPSPKKVRFSPIKKASSSSKKVTVKELKDELKKLGFNIENIIFYEIGKLGKFLSKISPTSNFNFGK